VQKVCTRSVCSVADVAVVAATYPFYTQARKRALLAPGLSIGFGAATRYTRYERYDSWPVFLLEMRTPLALRRPPYMHSFFRFHDAGRASGEGNRPCSADYRCRYQMQLYRQCLVYQDLGNDLE
jgi:hypothetical protein